MQRAVRPRRASLYYDVEEGQTSKGSGERTESSSASISSVLPLLEQQLVGVDATSEKEAIAMEARASKSFHLVRWAPVSGWHGCT